MYAKPIVKMDLNSGQLYILTAYGTEPDWSRVGNLILFRTTEPGGGRNVLATVNATNGDTSIIHYDDFDDGAVWSPDGTEIAARGSAGIIVFSSFISPYRADRDAIREIMGDGDFVEVWVDATVETCEGRDVKGLYKKARAGEIPEFTGISAPYEAPEKPEVVLDTNGQSVEESVAQLIAYLEKSGYLGS